MIYMLLRWKIRDKIPRNIITTFYHLIDCARGVEKVLKERIPTKKTSALSKPPESKPAYCSVNVKCGFSKNMRHTFEVFRKRIQAEKFANYNKEAASSNEQVPPAPKTPTPKVSCYGCGAPGVVQTNCSNCAEKRWGNNRRLKYEVLTSAQEGLHQHSYLYTAWDLFFVIPVFYFGTDLPSQDISSIVAGPTSSVVLV
ncbi:hypothetical protein K1T71_013925 [Dendrolimus kikuchii]|uniref:Uncharacterized protein n=1 Tax=Dendrolimus kikuchii TaxID=765133 RepID=A0ACC1CG67_9NEOP|nr:hypothetical protein K1T71_013925 [Dendrolimus kikuchii]